MFIEKMGCKFFCYLRFVFKEEQWGKDEARPVHETEEEQRGEVEDRSVVRWCSSLYPRYTLLCIVDAKCNYLSYKGQMEINEKRSPTKRD